MTHRLGCFVRWDDRLQRECRSKAHYVNMETGKAVDGRTYYGEFVPDEPEDEMCQRCQELVDNGMVIGFELEEWDE